MEVQVFGVGAMILPLQPESSMRTTLLLAGLYLVAPSFRLSVLASFRPTAVPPSTVQAPPGTDIYVASLTRAGPDLRVGAAVNLTARPGYDNQPFFSPDGKSLYFTSVRGGQSDIYRHDFGTRTTTQVTATPESEYSPTVMPDGKHLSVVRVERDSTQRLWAFTLDGSAVKPILDSIKPVGYHAWLNADTVFVFVLGSPATLRRAELAHGTAEIVARDIGRCISLVPGRRAISYVQRDSAGGTIRSLDPVTGSSTELIRLPEGTEFYAWTPNGEMLSARGNELLRWRAGDKAWSPVASFPEPGLRRISRIAVSGAGDRVALVGEEPAP